MRNTTKFFYLSLFLLTFFSIMQGQNDTIGNPAKYIDNNGLVVIEPENNKLPDKWIFQRDKPGHSGNGYIEWQGGDNFNSPGKGLIEYYIQITTPGTYRVLWRNRIGKGTDATEHNDSWVKFSDAGDFYGKRDDGNIVHPHGVCTGDCPKGAGSNGWFKVYSSGATNWKWNARTSDNDAHEIFVKFDTPGVYTMQISGRSNNHLIDKIILFHQSISEDSALADQKEETINPGYYTATHELVINTLHKENPLGSVPVTINQNSYSTDEEGNLQLNNLQENNYYFEIKMDNYEEINGTFFLDSNLVLNLNLKKTYTITFKVVSGEEPVQGVKIKINSHTYETDQEGLVTTNSISEGRYGVNYTHDDFESISDSITVSSNDSITVELLKITSSIQTINQPHKVYPNPFSDAIVLEGLETSSVITFFSGNGKIIHQEKAGGSKTMIQTNRHNKGIYFLNVTSSRGSSSYKLIKK